MSAVARVRAKLRLRQRFRPAGDVKGEGEIRWWLEHWDPVLRDGGFSPADVPELLGEPPGATYAERRRQQARAEVLRVLREAHIDDADFFAGKVVVDIGP